MKTIDEMRQELSQKKNEAQALLNDGKVAEAKEKMDEIKELKDAIIIQETLDKEQEEELQNKAKEKGKDNAITNDSIKQFAKAARNEFKNSMSSGSDEDGGYTVPEDIQTKILKWREAKRSLLSLVTITPVKTEKGSRTYKKRAQQTGFQEVGEGGKIPKKDTPKFERINYEIKKYAGYFPVTNELLADTDANIVQTLIEWIGDESRVTANKLILKVIDTITKKELKNLDSVKAAINVTLGAAFKHTSKIVTNDDGFQWMDTLKDGDGNYLLKQPITESSPHKLLGLAVDVVPNADMPSEENADETLSIPIIIGDLKEAVIYFDRKKLTIKSSDIAAIGDLNAFEEDLTLWRAIERETVKLKDEKAVVNGFVKIKKSALLGE